VLNEEVQDSLCSFPKGLMAEWGIGNLKDWKGYGDPGGVRTW